MLTDFNRYFPLFSLNMNRKMLKKIIIIFVQHYLAWKSPAVQSHTQTSSYSYC